MRPFFGNIAEHEPPGPRHPDAPRNEQVCAKTIDLGDQDLSRIAAHRQRLSSVLASQCGKGLARIRTSMKESQSGTECRGQHRRAIGCYARGVGEIRAGNNLLVHQFSYCSIFLMARAQRAAATATPS